MLTALGVTAGATAMGYGLGHQDASMPVATSESPVAPASKPTGDAGPHASAASPLRSAPTSEPAFDEDAALTLIRTSRETPYTAGRDHAEATYETDPGHVATEDVCEDAGNAYVRDEFSDYDVTSEASDLLLSEFVAGCLAVYEEGVYEEGGGDDTAVIAELRRQEEQRRRDEEFRAFQQQQRQQQQDLVDGYNSQVPQGYVPNSSFGY